MLNCSSHLLKSMLCCLVAMIATGCACNSQFIDTVSQVHSANDATRLLGPPDVTVKQQDGLVRSSWVAHETKFVPEKKIIVRGEGYPENDVIVEPEHTIITYCFYNVYSTEDGAYVSSYWEGNNCNALASRTGKTPQ